MPHLRPQVEGEICRLKRGTTITVRSGREPSRNLQAKLKPSVLDLFAGAGGFSLGFHRGGFRTIAAIDHDPEAGETLEANFSHLGTQTLVRDLSAYSPPDLERDLALERTDGCPFDVIIGGPPCQGWSRVGRGKLRSLKNGKGKSATHKDPRNELYKKFLGYVQHFLPPVAVMENVPGMLSHGGNNVAEVVAGHLQDAGYEVSWALLNAVDYGVPQLRERLFFVGVRRDLGIRFSFPQHKRSARVTVRDAIADLPTIRNGSQEWIRPYSETKVKGPYVSLMRAGAQADTIYDHVCRTQNNQDLEAFRLMKQGGWYRDLPSRLKRYRDDIFKDKYKKLYWDQPSWCVTAHLSKDCYTHIHPGQARTLSVREAARLQSFPDCFYFAGNMGTKFRLIGNAVPPLLAEQIARAVQRQVFKSADKDVKAEEVYERAS